ncbi:MAG: hypothetical protein M3521_04315 [Acidobacteriota bacterium]|nr:hypothetical protein [Acidobacteriota bacterium]
MQRFLFIFTIFIFPFFISAQNVDEAAKEKLRQETVLLERILADAKNLRLPENRAFIYAKVGNALWQTNEKRARELFQNSINDLIAAQMEAEAVKGKKEYLNNLIYGQSPRWDILHTVAAHDAEFALDAMLKTRPVKMAQAIANLTGHIQSQSQHYARNEVQSEQRIIAMAVEQNPQRAVKLLRESLKKDVSYDTVNLLKKIHQKEPQKANELIELVAQKLLDTNFGENNQDTSFVQYFLGEFGQAKTEETPTLKLSDRLLRDLADKIAKFILRPGATSFYGNASALKVIERFFPASFAQIKQKQAKFENQSGQSESFNKLMQSETSTEELLSQADKYSQHQRVQIYRRAAEKTAQSGNVPEAQKIIATNMSEEESDSYLSQFYYNLATQAISQGKFNEANQFINQVSDENTRMNALIYLATSIYEKAPQENQKWAANVLDQARAFIPNVPETTSEMNFLAQIAAAYAQIDTPEAFRLIESMTAPLNEYSEASAVVAKFSDYGNFRQGEYQISTGSLPFAYNLTNVLQKLKNKDFDRTLQFINGFNRLDTRIGLQIQLIDLSFSNSSIQNLPMHGRRFSSLEILR